MSDDTTKLFSKNTTQRWLIIKEQLIALCALDKLPKGNEEFKKFLSEDLDLKNLNAQTLNPLCYYTLGIINFEERNKLIQWPLINIKTNTQFRKGLSAMIIDLQKKYPWAHIKKLPESYFLNPHGYQSRVIDFVSRLTNLAIHIALDDPKLLFMHSGDGLLPREIAIMTEVITKAREREEELTHGNLIPLRGVEDVKDEVCKKCIALKQENDELQQQLNNLRKHAVGTVVVETGKKIDITDLKKAIDQKLIVLNKISEDLQKCFNASKELQQQLKALKNQFSLSSTNFGCQNPPLDLHSETSRVCGELCQFFQFIMQKGCTKKQEEDFYNKLKDLKQCLLQQNAALHSSLSNISLEGIPKL